MCDNPEQAARYDIFGLKLRVTRYLVSFKVSYVNVALFVITEAVTVYFKTNSL
jgi:hypothetical protein